MIKTQPSVRYGFEAACACLILALAGCATTIPAPTEQMAVSRAAVNDAVSAGGAEYAPTALGAAQDKLARASAAMEAADYPSAQLWAEEAEVDARVAATMARSAKAQRAVAEVRESIRVLQDELNRARR